VKKLFLIFLTLLSLNSALPQIKEIYSFQEAHEALESADSSTLVAFDCDDTLIVSHEPLLNFFNHLQCYSFYDKFFMFYNLITPTLSLVIRRNFSTYKNILQSKIWEKTHYHPTENYIVDIIRKLQQKGVKFITLTNQSTRDFEIIPDMRIWRYKKLCECGIDFSSSFDIAEIFFKEFEPKPIYGYPGFYKGILMSAGHSKGKVLGAFLDHIKFKPSKILFFDDLKTKNKEVGSEAEKRKIPCECFWYRYVTKHREKIDREIVKIQLKYLLKSGIFLNCEEIQEGILLP